MLGTSSTCRIKSLTLGLLLAAPLAWSQSPGTAAPPVDGRNASNPPPEQPQPEQPAAASQNPKPKKSAPFAVAQSPSEDPARKPLNLYLGNAKELLSNTQWETLLASQPPPRDEFEYTEPEPAETVRVKASRPPVPSGLAGLFWALRHPTQAWRAFTPATSEVDEEEEKDEKK